MKTKTIGYVMLIMLVIQTGYAQKNESNNNTENTIAIHLDNVAFDEDAYMKVLDSDNTTIAYYDRFENKSTAVKSVKIFNSNKELMSVLVPLMTDRGYEIHIKNKDGQRGYIDLTGRIKGLKAVYDSKVDYFQQPFSFRFSTKMGIGKVSARHAVSYLDKEVMTYETKVAGFSKVEITPFLVDKTFFKDHQVDVANWALIIQLMKELSLETSRINNGYRAAN